MTGKGGLISGLISCFHKKMAETPKADDVSGFCFSSFTKKSMLMNKLIKYGWSILLGLTAFSSCSSDEDADTGNSGPEPVKFAIYTSMPGQSRVVADQLMRTTFAKKDSVGIFAYRRNADGTDGDLYAANVKYVYDGAHWSVSAANTIMTEPGTAFNYYAYYPYRTDMANYDQLVCSVDTAQHKVQTKEEADSLGIENVIVGYAKNYAASDVMTAGSTETQAGERIIPLTFGHAFAVVRVRVTGTEATDTLTAVRLIGIKNKATIDVRTGKQQDAEREPVNIHMLQVSRKMNNMFYLAIVPAQDIAQGVRLVEVTTAVEKTEENQEGKAVHHWTATAPLSLSALTSHTLVVTLGDEMNFEPGPDTGGMDITHWLEEEKVEIDKVE